MHNPLRSPNRTTGVYIAAAMNLAVLFGYILVLSTVFAYSYQTYGYQPCHHSGVVNVSFDENSGRTVRRLCMSGGLGSGGERVKVRERSLEPRARPWTLWGFA